MAQPSEFLKLALIVFLAFMVSKSASGAAIGRAMSLAVGLPILTALGAVMLGRDMGTAWIWRLSARWERCGWLVCKRWFGGLVVLAVPTMVLLVLSNPTRIPPYPGDSPRRQRMSLLPNKFDHFLCELWARRWLTGAGGSLARSGTTCRPRTDFILRSSARICGLLGTHLACSCAWAC